jgi:hypothetical protein
LTTKISRLRTIPIFQDLMLGRGGNNEDYRNKFWGKFSCDATRVVNTRRYGRLDELASTSSAGQRSSTPISSQKRQDTLLCEWIRYPTSFSRIIHPFGLDWTDHTTMTDSNSTYTPDILTQTIECTRIELESSNSMFRIYQSDGKHQSSGILSFTPGYVRYAAGRIKKEGVVTIRNAVSGTCI